jgi:hypothetical protein
MLPSIINFINILNTKMFVNISLLLCLGESIEIGSWRTLNARQKQNQNEIRSTSLIIREPQI